MGGHARPPSAARPLLIERGGRSLSEDEVASLLRDRVMVLIPAYNERQSVADVIERVPAVAGGVETVVVLVDDGSRDGTATVAGAAGAVVVRQARRRGGGAALRTGYRLAAAAEASVVVTLDADGQHQPEEMERLVAPVLEGRAGLACGSRVLGTAEREGHARAVGIRLFSRLLSILLRQPITDCSNSFRAMRGDLPGALDLREDQFHAAELLVEAATRGTVVVEVPVTVRARAHGTTGKPPALRYGAGFTKAIAAAWLRSARRRSRRTDRTPLAVERAAPERPRG
jgi:glycosyltransferase involved in cell wall biosynthesis